MGSVSPQQASGQISITPGPGADTNDPWFGVRVYTESEIGNAAQDGQSVGDLFYDLAESYGETVGTPWLGPDDAPDVALQAGSALGSGKQVVAGLYRLTMRSDGNLVQERSKALFRWG
jgi:hypothetical protein